MNSVTIVVPVYNVEKYISDCIDSILRQSYKNFEVIFVDDGSKDESLNIIKSKILGFENCRVVVKDNGGLSSARNYGMKFVTTEFVTFLDSDDCLHENFLHEMMNSIGDADICCCGYNEVTEDGGFIRVRKNSVPNNPKEDMYSKVIEAIDFIPNAWGKLYKSDVYHRLIYPEGLLFEDYAICYKLFYNVNIKVIEGCMYDYRIRNGSIMRNFNANIIGHKLQILDSMKTFLESEGVYNKYKKNYINTVIFHGLFVTACIIINQSTVGSVRLLNDINAEATSKGASIINVILSRAISKKTKFFILLLKVSPALAIKLKKAIS